MPIYHVDDLDDPRLDAFARLTDTQLRCRLEPEKAICIAESHKVIERAFRGGYEPVSLLMEERFFVDMEPLIHDMEAANPELAVFVAPHEQLERLTGYELTRGALAAFRRPAYRPLEDVLEGARLVAVLENITNHTNVGAAFRSAAALGVDAIIATAECLDPLYRRAARVSMGTVFQVPWTKWEDMTTAEGIAHLQNAGFTVAALALSDDSLTLEDFARRVAKNPGMRVAVVLGTEGTGLTSQTIAACDVTVRIPMHHGVDSLNVAAASAVAFYAVRTAMDEGDTR